jgi:transposase InsO family protein
MQNHRETFRVGMMSKVLKVSRSGFYAWCRRGPSEREQEDQVLALEIHEIHRANRRAYGSPRIHKALRLKGRDCGRHRVARIMRLEGLQGCSKQRFYRTATTRSERKAAPDLLERDFEVDAPNKAWVGDITQVRTREGWLFLAVILDLYSRKVVGYATSHQPRSELALEALTMAYETRKPKPGLIHHTDRGTQYGSAKYNDQLDRYEMRQSMSRPGKCGDNAVAESFFRTIKTESLYHIDFESREQARLEIFDYIEGFYNRTRMHSTLDYQSPEEYERLSAA